MLVLSFVFALVRDERISFQPFLLQVLQLMRSLIYNVLHIDQFYFSYIEQFLNLFFDLNQR